MPDYTDFEAYNDARQPAARETPFARRGESTL